MVIIKFNLTNDNVITKKRSTILYFEENKERGFNFPYVVNMPNDIINNLPILVESYCSSEIFGNSIDLKNDVFERINSVLTYNLILKGIPVLMPVFPTNRRTSELGIYPSQLTRSTLLCNDEKYKRIDLLILPVN